MTSANLILGPEVQAHASMTCPANLPMPSSAVTADHPVTANLAVKLAINSYGSNFVSLTAAQRHQICIRLAHEPKRARATAEVARIRMVEGCGAATSAGRRTAYRRAGRPRIGCSRRQNAPSPGECGAEVDQCGGSVGRCGIGAHLGNP